MLPHRGLNLETLLKRDHDVGIQFQVFGRVHLLASTSKSLHTVMHNLSVCEVRSLVPINCTCVVLHHLWAGVNERHTCTCTCISGHMTCDLFHQEFISPA